jgi:hypothetical protein
MWLYTPVVEVPLESGASVRGEDDTVWIPFYEATYKGSLRIAELLSDHGADIEASTKHSREAIPEP